MDTKTESNPSSEHTQPPAAIPLSTNQQLAANKDLDILPSSISLQNAIDDVKPSAVLMPPPGKLFVGGLSWQTTAGKLQEYFSVFGHVTDVMIMRDPLTQRSRGFGFITFADPLCVEQVLHIPTHILDGKRIDPKHATPHQRKSPMAPAEATANAVAYVASGSSSNIVVEPACKLFVGGVSQETTADEVEIYFSQFGQVEEVVLPMDQQTQRHRGFGFVTFNSTDVVDQMCNLHYHTIKQKKVECKRAQPRGSGSNNHHHDNAISASTSMAHATAVAAAAAAAASQEYLQNRLLLNGLAGRHILAAVSPAVTQSASSYAYSQHHQQQMYPQQQHNHQRNAAQIMSAHQGWQNLLAMPNGGPPAAKHQFLTFPTASSLPSGYGKILSTGHHHSSPENMHANFRYKPYTVPIRNGQQMNSVQCEAAQPSTTSLPLNITNNNKPVASSVGNNGNNTPNVSVHQALYDAHNLATAGNVGHTGDSTAGGFIEGVDWSSIYRMGSVLPY